MTLDRTECMGMADEDDDEGGREEGGAGGVPNANMTDNVDLSGTAGRGLIGWVKWMNPLNLGVHLFFSFAYPFRLRYVPLDNLHLLCRMTDTGPFLDGKYVVQR